MLKQCVAPSEEQLKSIKDLVKKDRMLEVWKICQGIGALEEWQFGEPLRLASLITSRLGNRRLSNALDYLNYRHNRQHPTWNLYYQHKRVTCVLQVDILKNLNEFLNKHGEEMDDELRADYHIYRAWLYSSVRDFSRANHDIEIAKTIAPEHSWLYVQESEILTQQDRYEEAYEVATKALELSPLYHAAVLRMEDALIQLNRDAEALEILEQIHKKTEHGVYAQRMVYRYSEIGQHDKALWALREYQRLSPLLTEKDKRHLQARAGDFLYHKGQYAEAMECFRKTDSEFYKTILKNLEGVDFKKQGRKKLDVPFVRQHSMTCAPATLAAISRYWGKEHDHLKIAEAICSDGTPWHKEREWAEDQGFVVREFRLTEEIAYELTDKGIPFTLATSAVTSAHLQACIGYDQCTKVIYVRDPTHRHYGEFLIEKLIEDHPVQGPRCMVLLPKEKAELVRDVKFPDEEIYDFFYLIKRAMEDHDAVSMHQQLESMREKYPDHPMTLHAQIGVAYYETDFEIAYSLQKSLYKRFPENMSLEHQYLRASLNSRPREVQLEIARKAVARKRPDPVFYAELGDLLVQDLQELSEAEFYFKKAARYTFSDARSMASLGACAWRKNELKLSMAYRRMASCQDDNSEKNAWLYFSTAIECGKANEALGFLRQRTLKKSAGAGPWLTLSEAYETLNDDTKAREVILEALEIYPQNSELLLLMAERSYVWGAGDKAEEYLQRAKPFCPEITWRNAMAKLASLKGNRKEALHHLRAVVEKNPHFQNGQQRYGEMLEQEFGVETALKHLQAVAEKYPDDVDLLEVYGQCLSDNQDPRLKSVVERILKLEPNHLWAIREMALWYEHNGEPKKAISQGEILLKKQPNNVYNLGVLGGIYARNGQKEKAIELFERALRIDVDNIYPFRQWASLVEDNEVEFKKVLDFYKTELNRQVFNGASVCEFRLVGYHVIEPEIMLRDLEDLCEKQPFEWAVWVAIKDQLLDMERPQQAEKLMLKAAEKFKHIPRIYFELASVYRHLGDTNKVIEYLEKTLKMSPSWDWCARMLADAYEQNGDYDNAIKTLEKAIDWEPLIPVNHGFLADMYVKLGKPEKAFEILLQGLKNAPNYDWGWRMVAKLASDLKREKELIKLLEDHHTERKHVEHWWQIKFEVLSILGDEDKALHTLECGLLAFPESVSLHDQKAYYLSSLGRINEALAATHPDSEESLKTSHVLKARRACILYDHHQQPAAIEMMKDVVKKKPNYVFGLTQLVTWLVDDNKFSLARPLAEQWLRHEPDSVIARGFLGQIYESLKLPDKAMKYYRQAFKLDPSYTFSGYRIFELSLKSGDLDGLDEIIEKVQHYGTASEAKEMEVLYLHKLGKKRQAFAAFNELIQLDEIHISEIGSTIDLFSNKGVRALQKFVNSGKARNAEILAAWLWGRSNPLKTATRISKLPYSLELKEKLWSEFFDWAGENGDVSEIRGIYKTCGKQIQSSNILWAKLTNLLVSRRLYSEAELYVREYQSRENLKGWMLRGVSLAIAGARGLDAAEPALRLGVTDVVKDSGYNMMSLMLAFLEACRGNVTVASDLLNSSYGDDGNQEIGLRILTKLVMEGKSTKTAKQINEDWARVNLYFGEKKNRDPLNVEFIKMARSAIVSNGGKLPKKTFKDLLKWGCIIFGYIAIWLLWKEFQ